MLYRLRSDDRNLLRIDAERRHENAAFTSEQLGVCPGVAASVQALTANGLTHHFNRHHARREEMASSIE